jgi:hypothetical protein
MYLLPVSLGFLGLGYYAAYWRQTGNQRQKVMLWTATPIAILFWILPFVSR